MCVFDAWTAPRVAALALLTSLAVGVASAAVVKAGTDESTVNKSIEVSENTAVGDLSSVNGSIELGNGSSVGEVESVNGSIRLGDRVQVKSLETVNGGVRAGAGTRVAGDIEAVNGALRFGPQSALGGSIEVVNGSIELGGGSVGGSVESVNGKITASDVQFAAGIETVWGGIDLTRSAVRGDIVLHKPASNNWWGAKNKPPVLVIGPGSSVNGRIVLEHEAVLYVHESARVGTIEGGKAVRYSGALPN